VRPGLPVHDDAGRFRLEQLKAPPASRASGRHRHDRLVYDAHMPMKDRCFSRRLGLVVLALVFALFGQAKPAQADFVGAHDFDLSGVYLPLGIGVGAALRSQGASGLLIGGEVSLLRFWGDKNRFLGLYADYLYDRGVGTHRVSAGPELGLSWRVLSVGLDAGPVLEMDGDRTRVGVRPRLFASFLVFVAYAGETIRLTDSEARFATELGVLLKFPIPLAACSNDGCSWGRW
jgi:hypothetical protein